MRSAITDWLRVTRALNLMPVALPIKVTHEMVDAGLTVYEQLHRPFPSYALVEEIYKATWKHQ